MAFLPALFSWFPGFLFSSVFCFLLFQSTNYEEIRRIQFALLRRRKNLTNNKAIAYTRSNAVLNSSSERLNHAFQRSKKKPIKLPIFFRIGTIFDTELEKEEDEGSSVGVDSHSEAKTATSVTSRLAAFYSHNGHTRTRGSSGVDVVAGGSAGAQDGLVLGADAAAISPEEYILRESSRGEDFDLYKRIMHQQSSTTGRQSYGIEKTHADHDQLPPPPNLTLTRKRIGLAIAVHPPKYHLLARFLQQYAQCPAAMKAMTVHLVFSTKKDYHLWKQGLKTLKYEKVLKLEKTKEIRTTQRAVLSSPPAASTSAAARAGNKNRSVLWKTVPDVDDLLTIREEDKFSEAASIRSADEVEKEDEPGGGNTQQGSGQENEQHTGTAHGTTAASSGENKDPAGVGNRNTPNDNSAEKNKPESTSREVDNSAGALPVDAVERDAAQRGESDASSGIITGSRGRPRKRKNPFAIKGYWQAVIANPPLHIHPLPADIQGYSGWKKWYGMMHLLDLPVTERPDYGVMLDADLILNFQTCLANKNRMRGSSRSTASPVVPGGSVNEESTALAQHQPSHSARTSSSNKTTRSTGGGGTTTSSSVHHQQVVHEKNDPHDNAWAYFYDRVYRNDRSKRFPASEVSDVLEVYNLSSTSSWTGLSYDRALLRRVLPVAVNAANGALQLNIMQNKTVGHNLVAGRPGDPPHDPPAKSQSGQSSASIPRQFFQWIQSPNASPKGGDKVVVTDVPTPVPSEVEEAGGTLLSMQQNLDAFLQKNTEHLSDVFGTRTLFSWWADLPVVNLTVIAPMFVKGWAFWKNVYNPYGRGGGYLPGNLHNGQESARSGPSRTASEEQSRAAPQMNSFSFPSMVYKANSILPLKNEQDFVFLEKNNKKLELCVAERLQKELVLKEEQQGGASNKKASTSTVLAPEVANMLKASTGATGAAAFVSKQQLRKECVALLTAQEEEKNAGVVHLVPRPAGRFSHSRHKTILHDTGDLDLAGKQAASHLHKGSKERSSSSVAGATNNELPILPPPATNTYSFRSLARNLEHTNFEMITYHAFAMLVAGYRIRDVTNITGRAQWGSYLESPQLIAGDSETVEPLISPPKDKTSTIRRKTRGARAAKEGQTTGRGHKITVKDVVPNLDVSTDPNTGVRNNPNATVLFENRTYSLQNGGLLTLLNPLWASDEAVRLSEQKKIPAFSTEARRTPLFVFHVDHDSGRWGLARVDEWTAFLEQAGRKNILCKSIVLVYVLQSCITNLFLEVNTHYKFSFSC
ncbi:unnamed protein product [Amoebophrya sp. A120]|nr:unnamed protein product [Amoebophrya sp. A120]|eukprot:GSA120T00021165001.1